MKKAKKILSLITAAALLTIGLAGCTETAQQDNSGTSGTTQSQTAKLSGNISMVGSTSMEKLANALSEGFMAANPGVTVNAEFVGSSAGIESLVGGKCDIGNASRALKDSEKSSGAVENIVAIDGIAMVVNKANPVKNLSKDQLIGIYTGTIKNWSEVGGSDTAIVVVGREAGSGTRGAFEEILGIEEKCVYANELDSTGAAMAKAASTEGAIAYVSLDVINDTVNAVSLDNVEPTADNILSGSYFLCRPFVMATKGEISSQSDLVKAFFDYVESSEGQEIIKKVGLILPQ
ncbi:phosphate ABC transporter substrate-binding protein [Ructibacterium gallinarum]|uniref:Phosphate-binding protein n=1 Tax=Ructibacterium gallinarum TaxID=2779355 RepID=A0A9D5M020_9FIRM|nr:phosphate ABC transporter substrate-binding protein [Ructibacterium gallinarum]MBE5039666.1 phosphate ABC transporter substrate-binding protein [Ructibacterium gallinarum]